MKILVIGSGGREHAIIWALLQSTRHAPLQIFCAPGNAGIAKIATCIPISASNISALADFAAHEKIDLTVPGGEVSLAAGITDLFTARGMRIVGPSTAAARLESSKAFAKTFMQRHNIPTADFEVAESPDEVESILVRGRFGLADDGVVIKADGLAAGKGVIVARNRKEALEGVQQLSKADAAGTRFVIEEALTGKEISLIFFTDGETYSLMPPARDYKRLGAEDTGPNTGGMGAITAPGLFGEAIRDEAIKVVIEPTLEGLKRDGLKYCGVLYAGLMITKNGIRVLEYNVRFGDPEAEAQLIRLNTDLISIYDGIVARELTNIRIEWKDVASACIMLTSLGYPSSPSVGARISGLKSEAARLPGIHIFHSGTALDEEGAFVTAGGRVLGVTSTGQTLEQALSRCYRVIDTISWEGIYYRRDIGMTAADLRNGI